MESDRRDSYRVSVESEQVQVEGPAGLSRVKVIDLSASGGGLLIPRGMDEALAETPLTFQLGDYPAFESRVLPERLITGQNRRAQVGVSFLDLDRGALSSLSRFLIDQFAKGTRSLSDLINDKGPTLTVDRPDMVGRLLKFHCINKAKPLQVYMDDLLLPLSLRARDLTSNSHSNILIAEVLEGDEAMLEANREYIFTYTGSNALNYFKATIAKTEPGTAVIRVPRQIHQTGFRSSVRTPLMDEQNLKLKLDHPRLDEETLRKKLLEVSAEGFSFPLDPDQDLLFPGETIEEISLSLPQGAVRFNAILRSVYDNLNRPAWGLEIQDFASKSDAEQWKRFVFEASFSRLRLGTNKSVEQAWEMLYSSGYINETTPRLRPCMKKIYVSSWENHSDKHPSSQFLVAYNGKRPVGTVSSSLVYPGTWLIHHFGVDRDERESNPDWLKNFAWQLYCGILYFVQNLPNCEHFLIYSNADKPWNQLLYSYFVNRYSNKDDLILTRHSVYKRKPQDVLPKQKISHNGVEIVDDNPILLRFLSRFLKKNLNPVEFDAFSYRKKNIALSGFSQNCSDHGYERDRRIFFAVKNNKPLMAMVAESGKEGTNLFGLLNSCWLIDLEPSASGDAHIQESLFRKAIRHYNDLEKSEFILFGRQSGESEELLENMGFEHEAEGLRWIARRDVIPAYASYTTDQLGIN